MDETGPFCLSPLEFFIFRWCQLSLPTVPEFLLAPYLRYENSNFPFVLLQPLSSCIFIISATPAPSARRGQLLQCKFHSHVSPGISVLETL